MGLMMRPANRRAVIYCGVCGVEIKRAEDGEIAWIETQPLAEVRYLHKGACAAAAVRTLAATGYGPVGSEELEEFVVGLLELVIDVDRVGEVFVLDIDDPPPPPEAEPTLAERLRALSARGREHVARLLGSSGA
jgi:hypothetical protein